ncbi:hypothetical protein LY78DRAFT_649963 [Colletotrichum sublineola]|nr:hypothetical protein LY78DRAFT_649963 [Colletotrichum sublineola]
MTMSYKYIHEGTTCCGSGATVTKDTSGSWRLALNTDRPTLSSAAADTAHRCQRHSDRCRCCNYDSARVTINWRRDAAWY